MTNKPASAATTWARLFLQAFRKDELIPTRVVASAEGGVAICFVNGKKYADIECLNTGVILGVTSNSRDRPIVWKVEQSASGVALASQRIRKFINAPTPEKDANPPPIDPDWNCTSVRLLI